jgi:peptide/nickel transport system substrate-binding protein
MSTTVYDRILKSRSDREGQMPFRISLITAVAAVGWLMSSPLAAQELRIAVATPVTSMDPHFSTTPANFGANQQVFETLLKRDPQSVPTAALATEWKVLDDTTWEFKLRPGVRFQDGSPLTADDVVYSYRRAPVVPNTSNSFAVYTKSIKEISAVDPLTVRAVTNGPAPTLPKDMCFVMIMSKQATEKLTTADLDSGRGVIGTGPYKFKSWSRGDYINYERNDDYWGEKEPWERVSYRAISNGAARLSALLSGSVDLINEVPSADIPQVEKNPNVRIFATSSTRFVYLAIDRTDEGAKSGFLKDRNDKPLTTNPLKDIRVRKALELGIDVSVIRDKVVQGDGIVTGQYLNEGMFGYVPDIKPHKADIAAAKKLLADAGFPDGFKVTIHTSNDRISNSVRIAQTIGQMWARIGIQAQIESMPHAVFTPKRFNYPLSLSGWTNSAGDAGGTLGPVLHTRDLDKGFGSLNYMRYSNPELDGLVEKAIVTMDDRAREQLFQDATKIAIEDRVLLPIIMEVNNWGTRNSIVYVPRADAQTFAMAARPAQLK